MANRRKFTPEFKAEVVLGVLSGETSQAELCRRISMLKDSSACSKRKKFTSMRMKASPRRECTTIGKLDHSLNQDYGVFGRTVIQNA